MKGANAWLLASLLFLAACGDSSHEPVADVQVDLQASDEVSMDQIETVSTPANCLYAGTAGATSTCRIPTLSPEYYVEQALKYFDTLDIDRPEDSIPNYSIRVARWEWPPWLLLTGFGAKDMVEVGLALRKLDPSTVPKRDCRYFSVQPFARCYVEFEYENGACPIYEEFTFNKLGEMTFIEAWSDLPDLLPTAATDPWAEEPDFPRLSTRIPGLGNPAGSIEAHSSWMKEVAATDPDVADFALRITDWWRFWAKAVEEADEDFFAKGCGW